MAEGQDWGAKRAAAYDKRTREIFSEYEELHRHVLALVSVSTPAKGHILVLGAGTGQEALNLARMGYVVVGIDPSPDMLAVGRAKVEPRMEVQLIATELAEFPRDKRFDAVTSILVMHFVPDDGLKQEFLNEAAHRCKAGGRLYLADLVGEPGTPEFVAKFEAWKASLAERSTEHELERDVAAIQRDIHFIPSSRLTAYASHAGWGSPTLEWQSGMIQLWSFVRA